MEITEKVAYLKGLAEGLGVDAESKEGKILASVIDILDDMALEIGDMKDSQQDLGDSLDAVSDDLEDVENLVYGDDEEDEDESDESDEADDEEDASEDCYATTCPNCEETVYFDESILQDGEVICPNCGEKLEFDLGDVSDSEEDDGGTQE
jgi:ribosomal protein S27E